MKYKIAFIFFAMGIFVYAEPHDIVGTWLITDIHIIEQTVSFPDFNSDKDSWWREFDENTDLYLSQDTIREQFIDVMAFYDDGTGVMEGEVFTWEVGTPMGNDETFLMSGTVKLIFPEIEIIQNYLIIDDNAYFTWLDMNVDLSRERLLMGGTTFIAQRRGK